MCKKRQHIKFSVSIIGLLLFLGMPAVTRAQLRIAEPQEVGDTITCYVGGSSSYTLIPEKQKKQFMPTQGEMQKILNKIAKHTNLTIPIDIVAVENTENAEACPSNNGKNYVAFRTKWIQGLYDETNNEWTIYAVLAHEIGHFALGHDRVAYEKKLEEDADEYAGRILAMMNVSLPDTLSAFRSKHMEGIPGGKYPSVNERVAAATRGWESVKNARNTNSDNRSTNNTSTSTSDSSVKIDKQPNADAYYSRGGEMRRQKRYQEAASNFSAAIALEPNDAKAYYARGLSRGEYEDYRGAIEDYTKVIELEPNNASAYYARALDKEYGLKDYRGAIEDFTKVIELKPKDTNAYYARAGAKKEIKDYRGAIEDYTKVIDIDPNDDDAYYARGLTKYISKDNAGANADFRKACQMGNNSGCKAAK